MKSTDKRKDKAVLKRVILPVLLIVFTLAFLIISPGYFDDRLKIDHYREFMQPDVEPSVGVINVWHISSFKPYIGSLGQWLSSAAKSYASQYVNVYFSVSAFTPEEAETELQRGNKPDIISFKSGTLPKDMFRLTEYGDASACALPYCASGFLLIYDPDTELDKNVLIANAGTSADFKKGKSASCVCDIRETGDLSRAQLLGNCPYFAVEPIDSASDLVQFIGLFAHIPESKVRYAAEFIAFVISYSTQKSLEKIGLLPILRIDGLSFDADWIDELYSEFDPDAISDCFE